VEITNAAGRNLSFPGFHVASGATKELEDSRYLADENLREHLNDAYEGGLITVSDEPDGFPVATGEDADDVSVLSGEVVVEAGVSGEDQLTVIDAGPGLYYATLAITQDPDGETWSTLTALLDEEDVPIEEDGHIVYDGTIAGSTSLKAAQADDDWGSVTPVVGSAIQVLEDSEVSLIATTPRFLAFTCALASAWEANDGDGTTYHGEASPTFTVAYELHRLTLPIRA
jgi:hypothetical protein